MPSSPRSSQKLFSLGRQTVHNNFSHHMSLQWRLITTCKLAAEGGWVRLLLKTVTFLLWRRDTNGFWELKGWNLSFYNYNLTDHHTLHKKEILFFLSNAQGCSYFSYLAKYQNHAMLAEIKWCQSMAEHQGKQSCLLIPWVTDKME